MEDIRVYIEPIARIIEGNGVLIIAAGIAIALLRYIISGLKYRIRNNYKKTQARPG
jgi:hypothetical protein